tara:strand:- start:1049 stop:1207 length:159 start_codon:yes stop_codon:yes gene_type:complete
MAGVFKRVIENGLLDLLGHPVGMRSLGAGQSVDKPLRPIGLEVAADLVKLLA